MIWPNTVQKIGSPEQMFVEEESGTMALRTIDPRVFSEFCPSPQLGPFPDVSATYKALWRGPWAGIVHEQKLNKRLHLTTRLEYHLPDYDGACYWRSRTDLAQPVTNNHWASGQGINYTIFPGTDRVNFVDVNLPVCRVNLSGVYRIDPVVDGKPR